MGDGASLAILREALGGAGAPPTKKQLLHHPGAFLLVGWLFLVQADAMVLVGCHCQGP